MNDFLFATNEHGQYAIPRISAHKPAAKVVLGGGVWEPDTIAMMCQCARNGDIVHAGTYFGDFLPALDKAVRQHGNMVHAFEPVYSNYRAAHETIMLNGLRNVTLKRYALSSGHGMVTMATANGANGGQSRVASHGDAGVLCFPLDSLIDSDHVSVIQLDVEGHELNALKGAIETIRRCRPLLILEQWQVGQYEADQWFREEVMSLGYNRMADVHDNVVFG